MEEKEKKFKIIGLDDCEPCNELKEKLGDTVEFINLNTEEGLAMIERGEIPIDEDNKVKVPLAMDEKGQFCELFIDKDVVIAVCGDKQRILYDREEEESESDEK